MGATTTTWPGPDLRDAHYRVEQALVRNRYTVYDDQGNEVLKGKQKLFKLKEEFPFEHPDGTPAFTVKAAHVFDIAGDYVIQDPEDGDPWLVLNQKFTFFHHAWAIRDPQTDETLALVESNSMVLDVLRSLSGIFSILPYTYNITTPAGTHLGTIRERWSLRDKYDVEITGETDLPRAALVTAAIVIDAIEGQ